MTIKKAIITAAGNGTRMLPATKVIPKELLPISSIPSIDYIIKECQEAGIEEIILVINENKTSLMQYISYLEKEKYKNSLNFYFINQNELRGTTQAVLSCKKIIHNEDFAVIFPDEVSFETDLLLKMILKYKKKNQSIIGVKRIKKEYAKYYGIIEFSDIKAKKILSKIIEKPRDIIPSQYALCGRFVFKNNFFEYLENTTCYGKEYLITDTINEYCKNNICYIEKLGDKIFDIGNPTGYYKTIKYFHTIQNKKISE